MKSTTLCFKRDIERLCLNKVLQPLLLIPVIGSILQTVLRLVTEESLGPDEEDKNDSAEPNRVSGAAANQKG